MYKCTNFLKVLDKINTLIEGIYTEKKVSLLLGYRSQSQYVSKKPNKIINQIDCKSNHTHAEFKFFWISIINFT